MKHFFILGRNPELSKTEIIEFLKTRNRVHKIILFETNLLILETNEGEKFNIQEFGGILKLGEITFQGNIQEFEKYVDKNEIIPADKFSYAIFGNQEADILKEKFKSEKKKSTLKHGRAQIKFQSGEKQELPHAEFNLFYHEFQGEIYFGLATQEHDVKQVKSRDMNKPVRREHLAISPRIAKILINLSGAKPGGLMLDPFCGIGGILQEALLKQINVYGIDKDEQAIKDATTNLQWIKERYSTTNKYTLEANDAKKTPDLQFTAIATETPLGKVLRKKPNDNEAKQIIQNFEALIIPILTKLKKVKKPNAKIAITFPAIGKFHTNAKKIAQKTNLKIYIEPILESREDQFISRDIVVFQ